MAKTIFSNKGVLKEWAQGRKTFVRNKGRTLSAVDNVLYSYSTAIALWLPDEVLITTRKYSKTTSRHCSGAYHAAIQYAVNHTSIKRVPLTSADIIERAEA